MGRFASTVAYYENARPPYGGTFFAAVAREVGLDGGQRLLDVGAGRHREDEYSFVLEGAIGALLGDDVVTANRGDLVFKPRDQWHTFWNAGDAEARVLEIISPAGFECFFRELAAELKTGSPDPQRIAALSNRYEVDMDLSSVPWLVDRFGVRFPGGPPGQRAPQ